jgi:hypothetical protein
VIANVVGRAVAEVTLLAQAFFRATAAVARSRLPVIAHHGHGNDDRVVARARPVHGVIDDRVMARSGAVHRA